jgi:hypothetical protein
MTITMVVEVVSVVATSVEEDPAMTSKKKNERRTLLGDTEKFVEDLFEDLDGEDDEEDDEEDDDLDDDDGDDDFGGGDFGGGGSSDDV